MGEYVTDPVTVDVHWPGEGAATLVFTGDSAEVTDDELAAVRRNVTGHVRRMMADEAVLETRVPADLNPWAGVGVLALHSHVVDQPCDETCSEYR